MKFVRADTMVFSSSAVTVPTLGISVIFYSKFQVAMLSTIFTLLILLLLALLLALPPSGQIMLGGTANTISPSTAASTDGRSRIRGGWP